MDLSSFGRKRIGALLFGTCAAAVMVGGTAFAQDASKAAGANQEGLEVIKVTAEYRAEDLQKTPLAISAISGEQLEDRNFTSAKDLSAFVPNTVIQPLGSGWGSTLSAFIRGVGLGDNILSFEPGVPFYVDGVYVGRPQGIMFDLLDLDRVEVLRGPQGTLFGKNAIGGTVSLISNKPTGNGGGYVSAGTGSLGLIDARGAFDVSIIPSTLMMRVSASAKQQDGYGTVLDYICVHGADSLGTGGPGIPGLTPGIHIGSQVGAASKNCEVGHQGGFNDKAARVALRYVASSNFEINIVGDVTKQNDQGPVDKFLVLDPNFSLNALWNTFVAPAVYGPGVALDQRFLTPGKYTNYDTFHDPITGRNFPDVNDVLHWGVSGTIDWDIPGIMHVRSITAYRHFGNTFGRSSDGSPLAFNTTWNDNRHAQTTQEFQFTGSAFDRLDWTVGLFYYFSKDSDQGFSILVPYLWAVAPFPFPDLNTDNSVFQTTKDYAGFVHGVVHVTDKLSVTAGVRYTSDQKKATLANTTFFGVETIPPTSVPISATKWSPKAEVAYQWTDDLMTYAEWSTGFRGGGYAPRPSDAWQVRSFGPEELTSWELGMKTQLFGDTVRLNQDVFYEKYSKQQNGFNTTQPAGTPGAGSPWFATVNTGVSTIWGYEGEILAAPVDDMQIDLSLGYTHYYRTDPGLSGLCQRLPNGDPCYPPRTPRWNVSFGTQYGFHMGENMGVLTPRVDVRYQSAVFFTDLFNYGQKGYALVDARITWEAPDQKWSVALYGTNLTNQYYYYGKLSLQNALGFDQANPAPPAEWGLTVKRTF
jgi:iron complex outermembrane receptor protein